MKRLRALYGSLKFWWRLCPLRRKPPLTAVLFGFDELDLDIKTEVSPGFFDGKMFGPPDRRVTFTAHIASDKDAPGLVYILLPEEKA